MLGGKDPICQVCGSEYAQFHFGAVTCRACAAFFRRFVNSKKRTVVCKCDHSAFSRYACRLCRIKKCLSVGMKTSLVQSTRDSNSPKRVQSHYCESPLISNFVSCIEYPIALRNIDRLKKIQQNYVTLVDDRKFLKVGNMSDEKMNMYELTCMAINDLSITSKMLEKAFPELDALGEIEKRKICTNFYPKWAVLEAAMYAIKSQDSWHFHAPSGQPVHTIDRFYTLPEQKTRLTPKDMVRIFSPYWAYYTNFLMPEVIHQKLQNFEYMALLAVVLLDPGYSNLSEESVEMCRNLKSLYLKEFVAYYRESNRDESDRRFFNILDLLQHIEKGEALNQEEVQMCLVHDIIINDDYRKLLTPSKY